MTKEYLMELIEEVEDRMDEYGVSYKEALRRTVDNHLLKGEDVKVLNTEARLEIL